MIVVYVIAAVLLARLAASVRILKQYEGGVQFRLGRVKDGARGPGLIFTILLVDR
jgi:regulator of protease activity HflC (stomatin/prohibitin superfamily)